MTDENELPPETHLADLGPSFVEALKLRGEGSVDAAMEKLRAILKAEPRLAEPRLEVARILLELGQLEDAEAESREALRILESGGQWTDDLPENVVLAVGYALLGEVLKERASSDEVVFGPEDVFRDLIESSRAAFARAHALDPSDTASFVYSAELGDGGGDGDEGDDDLPAARRAMKEMTGDIADEDPDELI
jgi:tetratricopeptide (TPR) repeat protein